MRTPLDPQFREEARHFSLRFTCQDCAHFAEQRRACANGYPNDAHLDVDLERRTALEFCKEFELA